MGSVVVRRLLDGLTPGEESTRCTGLWLDDVDGVSPKPVAINVRRLAAKSEEGGGGKENQGECHTSHHITYTYIYK